MTSGSNLAGWPTRTVFVEGETVARRATMLSTLMLEGPQTRMRCVGCRARWVSRKAMRVAVLPVPGGP